MFLQGGNRVHQIQEMEVILEISKEISKEYQEGKEPAKKKKEDKEAFQGVTGAI